MKRRPHATLEIVDSRRKFVGTVAYGLAGTLAAGSKAHAASDRIRVGLIGAGDRGTQLAHHVKASGNAEVVAAADIYARRRELAAGNVLFIPPASTSRRWQR